MTAATHPGRSVLLILLALLVFLGTGFAYLGLGHFLLDEYPLPVFAGLLAAAALAAVALVRERRRWLKVAALVPLLLAVALAAGILFLFSYGPDRPAGIAVGDSFPTLTVAAAAPERDVTLGGRRAGAGHQLVICFRGFW